MNKLVKIFAALSLVCVFSMALSAEEKKVDKKAAGPVVVDLTKPLPGKINVVEGEQVVFQNNEKIEIVIADSDKKGELLAAVKAANPVDPKTGVVYDTKRPGIGEITVIFPKGGKLARVRSYKINLLVKEAPTAIIDVSEIDSGKTITVKQGSIVNIHLEGIPNDTGYGSWSVSSSSGDTVKQLGSIDTSIDNTNPDNPNNRKFTAHFKAVPKAGNTSIYMEYKSSVAGAPQEVRTTFSITIEVK